METLQRIYAISFPDTKLMKEWKQFQEEAAASAEASRERFEMGLVIAVGEISNRYELSWEKHLIFVV